MLRMYDSDVLGSWSFKEFSLILTLSNCIQERVNHFTLEMGFFKKSTWRYDKNRAF